MDQEELSRTYYKATARIANAATSLYESLHDEGGNPRVDADRLHNTIRKFKRDIDGEFDMIRAALLEYYDDNADIS
ncbi:hypothetical protein EBT25_16350 [bacterium]|jgi:hypothetical protein|nr:hypothetical protein [bacterium]